jgi:quercetin dioxygenase-like cupin family protein
MKLPDIRRVVTADDAQGRSRMHRTGTVDYAIVLEGEVWAVMDQGETLLRAGDVLIPARHQPRLGESQRAHRAHRLRADRRRASGVD